MIVSQGFNWQILCQYNTWVLKVIFLKKRIWLLNFWFIGKALASRHLCGTLSKAFMKSKDKESESEGQKDHKFYIIYIIMTNDTHCW